MPPPFLVTKSISVVKMFCIRQCSPKTIIDRTSPIFSLVVTILIMNNDKQNGTHKRRREYKTSRDIASYSWVNRNQQRLQVELSCPNFANISRRSVWYERIEALLFLTIFWLCYDIHMQHKWEKHTSLRSYMFRPVNVWAWLNVNVNSTVYLM